MSTARTTRSTTKAASSRGASPAFTEASIPTTPSVRSKRTAGPKAPLPTVAGRSSTAYGINAHRQPASLNIPESGQDVNNVLSGLLEPQGNTLPTVREEETPGGKSRRGHSANGITLRHGKGTASVVGDRSYNNESQIFGYAGVEDSSVASPMQDSPPAPVQRMRPSLKTRQDMERWEREQALQKSARTPVTRARETAAETSKSLSQWMARSIDKGFGAVAEVTIQLGRIWAWMKNHLKTIALISIIALSLLSLLNAGSYRWYGMDVKHNVGQFLPDFVSNPGSAFNPSEINQLRSRIKQAEYDLAWLKKRGEIDEKALADLKDILPDHVIVKKTPGGKLEITQDFWHALDSKMRSENAYRQPTTGQTSGGSATDVSIAQVENLMEKSKMWDRYLQNSRVQLKEWAGEEFDARFPEKFKNSIEINKADFIALVWEDSQNEIREEIRRLSSRFDDAIRNVQHSEGGVVGHTREQIKAISTDVFRSVFSSTQLEALAKANKNINAAATEHRLNHFSPQMGAIINPKLTSPNFIFPSMNYNFISRGFRKFFIGNIPRPTPPEVALRKWEESGDCWCSPSTGKDGFGSSLAVMIKNKIYPDQVIIEHMPPSGSMEPGAAPKDMELLAYIEDPEIYQVVKQRSEQIFSDEREDEEQPYGFVRIGTWTYDAHSMSNVQSFPLQIELGTIKGPSHTNRLIVRSKNNWGEGEVEFTCLYRVRVNGDIAKV